MKKLSIIFALFLVSCDATDWKSGPTCKVAVVSVIKDKPGFAQYTVSNSTDTWNTILIDSIGKFNIGDTIVFTKK